MKTRSVYIETAKSLSPTGTVGIDIKTGAPISMLELIFGGTKGATENKSDKLQDYVTKIELVDGADVLWSLSMVEAVALNCYEMGKRPACDLDLGASGTPQESVWINFGFFPFDPNHYLDTVNYANLQLKLTTANTVHADTYTDSFVVDIIAHVIDEGAGAYAGFLMAKEHYSWTTTVGGIETIDLPLDFPYRFVLVKALETKIAPEADISNIKMTCDADRFIVFDIAGADLVYKMLSEYGLFHETIKSNMQDDDVMLSTFYNLQGCGVIGGTDLYLYRVLTFTAEEIAVLACSQGT